MEQNLKQMLNTFFLFETMHSKLGLKYKDKVLVDYPYADLQTIEQLLGQRNQLEMSKQKDIIFGEINKIDRQISNIGNVLLKRLPKLLVKYFNFFGRTYSSKEIINCGLFNDFFFNDLNKLKSDELIEGKQE